MLIQSLVSIAVLVTSASAQYKCPYSFHTFSPASSTTGAVSQCCPDFSQPLTKYPNYCKRTVNSEGIFEVNCTVTGVQSSAGFAVPGVGKVNSLTVVGQRGQAATQNNMLGGYGLRIEQRNLAAFGFPGGYFLMRANYHNAPAVGGATKGVTWGEGGGYSSLTSTYNNPDGLQPVVASGGGGGGLDAPGQSAMVGAPQFCFDGTDGANPSNNNGSSINGGGGGGCQGWGPTGPPSETYLGAGGNASSSLFVAARSTLSVATVDLGYVSMTMACEAVVNVVLTDSTTIVVSTQTVATEVVTPSTVTATVFTSVATAVPDETTTSTFVPATETRSANTTVVTTPAVVNQTQTVRLSDILTTETRVETSTLPTSTVDTTYTPPTSTITSTVTRTATLPLSVVNSTSTPLTATITSEGTTTTFAPTRVVTSTFTSSTGVSNCVQFRMVYPAKCCPTNYIAMSGRARHRRGLHGKRTVDAKGSTFATATVTARSTQDITTTSRAPTPTETVRITSSYANTTRTIVEVSTAETPLTTSTLTINSEAPTPTDSYTTTLDASTVTLTVTQTSTLEAPTTTATFNASTPLATEYPETTTTLDALTSTATFEAATPLTTVYKTVTVEGATPVRTVTTTAFARSTACALTPGGTQSSCPLPILAGLDQATQIVLLKAKKALSGKPVIVDCGTAGTFYY